MIDKMIEMLVFATQVADHDVCVITTYMCAFSQGNVTMLVHFDDIFDGHDWHI